MSIQATAGQPFEATVQAGATGLTGTLGVRIIDGAVEVAPRTTAGIVEGPPGSGFYTATLTAPSAAGTYSVFWDTGTVTPNTTAAEELVVTGAIAPALPTPPVVSTPQLAWVRRLIEDMPRTETEQAVASGIEVDFYLSNPPATGNVSVSANGVLLTENTDYLIFDGRLVRFAAAPLAGTNITIQYTRQTFSDEELQGYLSSASERLGGVGQVYQAAVYAIDSLLVGAATALDFGAGAESYNMSSVFQRLTQLRGLYAERVAEAIDAEGVLVISDLEFDGRGSIYWTDL